MSSPSGSNSISSNKLDQIVHEVVRRLTAAHNAQATAENSANNGPATKTGALSATTLMLSERVITTELLRDRLAGVARVVVDRRAIVTPLVRDELRQKKIGLEQQDFADGTTSEAAVQIVCHATDIPPRASRQLSGEAVEWARIQELEPAVAKVQKSLLRGNQKAVIVTNEPELAVCMANRDQATRAAHCDGQESLQRACSSLGCNVLVTQPSQGVVEFIGSYLRGSPATS